MRPPLRFIRLSASVALPEDSAGARAQCWIPYSPDALRHLQALADAGNDLYGAGTHRVEDTTRATTPVTGTLKARTTAKRRRWVSALRAPGSSDEGA